MSDHSQSYELIDFGYARKLERFGRLVVDRPCPAATDVSPQIEPWLSADLIFGASYGHENNDCEFPENQVGNGSEAAWQQKDRWRTKAGNSVGVGNSAGDAPNDLWLCQVDGLTLKLKPQDSGQIGVFPEHWQHWDWFRAALEERKAMHQATGETLEALHLFAYTGATSLALATMGYSVTHVDAMKSAVDWARDNAKLSNLQSLPIRWIVEDARVYVSREIKRGRRYDLIVLDPPSYGHGPRGKAWEIHRDLLPLLSECWYLLSDTPIGVLMCGHSPDVDIKLLHSALARKFGREKPSTCEVSQAKLIDRSGRSLDCGYSAKFSFNR